jgi:2-oxoglutarate ferredoxin oxidoreductase subunit delta
MKGVYTVTTAAKPEFHPKIFKELCKQCGICYHFCPRGVLGLDDKGYPAVKNPEKCNGCLMCFLRCPDFALEVINGEE